MIESNKYKQNWNHGKNDFLLKSKNLAKCRSENNFIANFVNNHKIIITSAQADWECQNFCSIDHHTLVFYIIILLAQEIYFRICIYLNF